MKLNIQSFKDVALKSESTIGLGVRDLGISENGGAKVHDNSASPKNGSNPLQALLAQRNASKHKIKAIDEAELTHSVKKRHLNKGGESPKRSRSPKTKVTSPKKHKAPKAGGPI